MKFITRRQLLNRAWSVTDLEAVAEFWLRLYETAALAQGFTNVEIFSRDAKRHRRLRSPVALIIT